MTRHPAIFCLLFTLACTQAEASHIVGGEVTYKFLGDTNNIYNYEVSLTIYEDCLNGEPSAIQQDNPAYMAVYEAGTNNFVRVDSVYYTSAVSVPANFSNACINSAPLTCLLKKTFVITYALAANTTGYIIDYQRCCRNNAVMNIQSPGDEGSTYFCFIPPAPLHNNSAVFKNYPPQIICLNNPLVYDHSASDTDGDSLSYGFTTALLGASSGSIKPFPPSPPPFDTVIYNYPYSSQMPMSAFPAIQINSVTGLITGTPNRTGRYLVTVYCNEYRDGALINTITREFQFVVTDCSMAVVADIPQFSTEPNTYIVDCQDYTVHFVNTSTGGFSYYWNFGSAPFNDTSTQFEPTYVYPDTGTFNVKLVVNPGSTCQDSIIRLVKIYPKFHAAFIDSGNKCPGMPLSFIDQSTATIKPVTAWNWDFGDGITSTDQNPLHSYQSSGIYNVVLESKNIKNCADTAIRQVYIDDFVPFAGNDTTMVKGESIQFNAAGGTQYAWTPGKNLSDTNISNPIGYFPDTGHFHYMVFVTSLYGCSGYDTVSVTVVENATFFVPSAFTPNGDGLNDVFEPVSIGYKNLNYFRVFNRWGQEVYFSTNLETGWDGTFHNKVADIGTYYWELKYTDRFGKEGVMKGDVTLIR